MWQKSFWKARICLQMNRCNRKHIFMLDWLSLRFKSIFPAGIVRERLSKKIPWEKTEIGRQNKLFRKGSFLLSKCGTGQ